MLPIGGAQHFQAFLPLVLPGGGGVPCGSDMGIWTDPGRALGPGGGGGCHTQGAEAAGHA